MQLKKTYSGDLIEDFAKAVQKKDFDHLTEILVKNGFSVSVAENGEEALVKIKADKPQLILMDVVMPGKNGFQVTRAIARDPDTQDVPVIICTSKDQETDRIWGLRQGARDYLIKPIDADELLAKIASLG